MKPTGPATLHRLIEDLAALGDREGLVRLADNALNRMNAAPRRSGKRELWALVASAIAQRSMAVGIRLGHCKGSLDTAARFETRSEECLQKIYNLTRGRKQ